MIKKSKNKIDARELPVSLQNIVDLIGINKTLCLVEKWGGSSLPVLRHIKENHQLVKLLGTEAITSLANHFGSERFYIPRAVKILRQQRNREIRAAYDSGMTGDQVARKFKISATMIWKILKSNN
ncbi:MAG: hypothetical protein HQL64_06690 [Magnetococcales bacterium]|nr:hypothetical protein [Magnetococcales bacterium]